jgi:hypothetical protein
MFHSRISGMVMVGAILIDLVRREVVDAIQNQIVIIGFVYAVYAL